MTRYRDKDWSARFASLGDEAEGVFLDVRPLGPAQRLGWKRPQVTMRLMPPALKHLPDYYTASGFLVEVMGMGSDGVMKLKLSKWEALKFWNALSPVALFLWNSGVQQWRLIPWQSLRTLVRRARSAGVQAFENDGNEYYPIQWAWITADREVISDAEKVQLPTEEGDSDRPGLAAR